MDGFKVEGPVLPGFIVKGLNRSWAKVEGLQEDFYS
jgi:hypothetical protein